MFDITAYILIKNYTTSLVNKQAGQQIELADYEGILDEEALKKLTESTQSSIILDGKLFRLSRNTPTEFKYLNSTTDGHEIVINMTELDVNKETGEFLTRKLIVDQSSVAELRAEFEAHRDNTVVHINSEERNYWNNKISAEVEHIAESNYKLNLIK